MPKLKPGTIVPTKAEDEAINRGIAVDPDTYELSGAKVRHLRRVGRPKSASSKVQLTVRYDADVVSAFKADGPGWQTRMNDALRDWLVIVCCVHAPRRLLPLTAVLAVVCTTYFSVMLIKRIEPGAI